jgi:hypothetical protein
MPAGRLIIPLSEPILFASGLVAPNSTMTVFLTGTDTAATLYADEAMTTEITNPQVSNAAGRFYNQSTTIWADDSVGYDVVLNLTDGEVFGFTDVFLLGSQTAGGNFMPISGGTFTGPVFGLTPAANDDSTLIPNTAWVQGELAAYAPLISPALSGIPTVPTAAPGTSTTQAASTAFTTAAIAAAAVASLIVAYAECSISGGTLTINKNSGFSAVTRTSAGAYNFTFSVAEADANYLIFTGVTNLTQLAAVSPPANKTTSGFAISVLTYNNIPNDCSAIQVMVLAA